MNKNIILGLGNLYVETNFLGVETAGLNELKVGNEYSAPGYEVRLGGSAVNFITQIKRYGLACGIIGKCGLDEAAKTLFKLLQDEGIKTDLIKKSSGVLTNIDSGIILKHSAQNIQIVAGSANQSLAPEDIDFDSEILKNVSAIYFGGSFKQKNLWPHYPEIFKKLYKKGIKLFIDPGRVPVDADGEWVGILKDVLIYTYGYFPNDKEILDVTGESDINAAIETVLSWGVEKLAVKKGPEGCIVCSKSEKYQIKGFKVEAVSTVGAGDCFNASFIAALTDGKSLKEAGEFATAAASIRVSKNYQPGKAEVEKLLNKD
jgi:sugar/nucleoside kinase (ribokinase family)